MDSSANENPKNSIIKRNQRISLECYENTSEILNFICMENNNNNHYKYKACEKHNITIFENNIYYVNGDIFTLDKLQQG